MTGFIDNIIDNKYIKAYQQAQLKLRPGWAIVYG